MYDDQVNFGGRPGNKEIDQVGLSFERLLCQINNYSTRECRIRVDK